MKLPISLHFCRKSMCPACVSWHSQGMWTCFAFCPRVLSAHAITSQHTCILRMQLHHSTPASYACNYITAHLHLTHAIVLHAGKGYERDQTIQPRTPQYPQTEHRRKLSTEVLKLAIWLTLGSLVSGPINSVINLDEARNLFPSLCGSHPCNKQYNYRMAQTT